MFFQFEDNFLAGSRRPTPHSLETSNHNQAGFAIFLNGLVLGKNNQQQSDINFHRLHRLDHYVQNVLILLSIVDFFLVASRQV